MAIPGQAYRVDIPALRRALGLKGESPEPLLEPGIQLVIGIERYLIPPDPGAQAPPPAPAPAPTGILKEFTTVVAAGAEPTFIITPGKIWRLMYLFGNLQAGAAVVTRLIMLQVLKSIAGNIPLLMGPPSVNGQQANELVFWSLYAGAPQFGRTADLFGTLPMPDDGVFFVGDGSRVVRLKTINIQPADQWTNVTLWVNEYDAPPAS